MVFIPQQIGLYPPVLPEMDDEFLDEVVIGEEPRERTISQTVEGGEVERSLLVVQSVHFLIIFMVPLNYVRNKILLEEVVEVKHKLLIKQGLILVGYSTESLRKNQLIYEVYYLKTGRRALTGRISMSGLTFLTDYVRFRGNMFLNLITMGGRKIIELNDFEAGRRSQLVKNIDYKDYQLKPTKEKYALSYNSGNITLVEITETPPLVNILVRVFNAETGSAKVFRVISFDPIPQVYLGCGKLSMVSQWEITCMGSDLDPSYYEMSNWQNIRIVLLHEQLIITFNQGNDYFSMCPTGKIVQLANNVKSISANQKYVGAIVQSTPTEKKLVLYEFNSKKKRYDVAAELELPVEAKCIVGMCEWVKIELENGSNETSREFLVVELKDTDQQIRLSKTEL